MKERQLEVKQDTTATNLLVVCIPSKDFPTFPEIAFKEHGNRYTEDKCDGCGCGIWLGVKSAEVAKSGVPKVCPYCAQDKYGADLLTSPLTTLTKSNPGGKNKEEGDN